MIKSEKSNINEQNETAENVVYDKSLRYNGREIIRVKTIIPKIKNHDIINVFYEKIKDNCLSYTEEVLKERLAGMISEFKFGRYKYCLSNEYFYLSKNILSVSTTVSLHKPNGELLYLNGFAVFWELSTQVIIPQKQILKSYCDINSCTEKQMTELKKGIVEIKISNGRIFAYEIDSINGLKCERYIGDIKVGTFDDRRLQS